MLSTGSRLAWGVCTRRIEAKGRFFGIVDGQIGQIGHWPYFVELKTGMQWIVDSGEDVDLKYSRYLGLHFTAPPHKVQKAGETRS